MIAERLFLGVLLLATAAASGSVFPLRAQEVWYPETDRELADELDGYLAAARDHDRFSGSWWSRAGMYRS